MPKGNREILIQALTRMLKPIMRFCVRHGLKIQDVTECAKRMLTQAATEELKITDAQVNVSKLSVMTGLHRRDVVRLGAEPDLISKDADIVSRVIGTWQTGKRFQDSRGRPRELNAEGKDSEFFDLIHSVSSDVNGYTVLNELIRLALVEKLDGKVKLCREVYVSSKDQAEGYRFLGTDIEDLISAADENLNAKDSAAVNLHLKTEFDNIPIANIPEIRAWCIQEGSGFQKRVREYLAPFDRDISPKISGEGRARVAVGAFSFIEEIKKEK